MRPKGSSPILFLLLLQTLFFITSATVSEDLINGKTFEESLLNEEASQLTQTLSNQGLTEKQILEQFKGIEGVPVANAPKIDDAAGIAPEIDNAVDQFFRAASSPHAKAPSVALDDYPEVPSPMVSGSFSQVASSVLSFGVVMGFISFLVAM